MFLEIHLLQNFALSNLNRDGAGAPKSCEFGGIRRARISSQCLKRAVRTYFLEEELVPSSQLGHRTRRLRKALLDGLTARGESAERAAQLATAAVEALSFKLKKERTEYLLMLGTQEIERLVMLTQDYAEALLEGEKKAAKGEKGVGSALLEALDGGGAIDIALFGRMIADHPEKNVDAAVQMAHAFSTNAVATEFDFYSAVDDLQESDADEGAGAGMLGTTLYNSSCYYRYANLDLKQLATNLGGDANRAAEAATAFLQAAIHSVPSGKQTNSAAQNPPALLLFVLRERGLWSLANAFVRPVRQTGGHDLVEGSAHALLGHWAQLTSMYGTTGIRYAGLASYLKLPELPDGVVAEASAQALCAKVAEALAAAQN